MTGFFSREAGQKRRAWLDGLLSDYIGEPARYFLGPTGIPQKAAQAAGLLDFTDAGDMVAAADASRELWNNPSIGNAANYAAAGAAMALPFYSAKMGQGVADLADDARRFVTDEDGAIRLWHGSPHDFDKFSMDAIGTGEGAQAYGHGLYFAERPEIAEFYRDNYAKPDASRFSTETARQKAQDQLQAWAGDIPGGIDDLKASLKNMETTARFFGADEADAARMQDLKEAIAYMEAGAPRGRLYEVDVNANPEDFLDWDAPLSAQPGKVREALAAMDPDTYSPGGVDYDPTELGQITYQRLQNQKRDYGIDAGKADLTTLGGSQRGATDDLQGFGIPGIRYLDAGSRGAGDGSRNYVVFDENLVQIVRKYGIAGAAVVLGVSASDVQAAMDQGQRGVSGVGLMPDDEEKQQLSDYLGLFN